MHKKFLAVAHTLNQPQSLRGLWLAHSDEPLVLQWLVDLCRPSWQANHQLIKRIELNSTKSWQEVSLQLDSLSLFSENYALILTGKQKPDADILDYLANFAERAQQGIEPHHVLWLLPKQDKKSQNSKAFKTFEKFGDIIDANIYQEKDRADLLQFQMQRFGLQLTPSAWQILLSHTEHDLLSAYQNLWRLSYLYGIDGAISPIDDTQLLSVLTDGGQFSVFDLSDSLLSNNAQRCLKIIQHLQQTDTAASIALWAIAKDCRAFAALQAGSTTESLGIWRSKASQYQQRARQIPPATINLLLTLIYEADTRIKGVNDADAWQLIKQICLTVCGISP